MYVHAVVVCLPISMEGGESNFQIFTELTVPPQAAGVVGTLKSDNKQAWS